MSWQWEKYVPAAADALYEEIIRWPDDAGLPYFPGLRTEATMKRLARVAVGSVGQRIADDTRERIVAAAARAVERDGGDPLAKVRELHSAKPVPQPSHFKIWCDECQCSWPCRTAAILEAQA